MIAPVAPRLHTFDRRWVNPMALRPEDVRVEAMAHALALINRFCGHTREPISVAQHSVYASWMCGPGVAGWQALFHDGAEHVLGDMTKWVKHSDACEGYRVAEDAAQRVIYAAMDCPLEMLPEVEAADRLLVRYEGTQGYGEDWLVGHPAYPTLTAEERAQIERFGPWRFWPWQLAEHLFLERYKELRDLLRTTAH